MVRLISLIVVAGAGFVAAYGIVRLMDRHVDPPGMVWIPGGEFTMGSDVPDALPAEHPAHRVRVDGYLD